MTPRTLRRKLQKKKKHRSYGKCPVCGGRSKRVLLGDRLFDRCFGYVWMGHDKLGNLVTKPHYLREIFWTGGGTADTYRPDEGNGKG